MSYYYSRRYRRQPEPPEWISSECVVEVEKNINKMLSLKIQMSLDQIELLEKNSWITWDCASRGVGDIYSFIKENGKCSEKQRTYVKAVIKKFSFKELENIKKWNQQFSDENKLIFKRCCRYYAANFPYYRDVVESWKKDPNYIPTYSEYSSMCENKYVKKVLENYEQAPRFTNGQIVLIRDGSKVPHHLIKSSTKGKGLAGSGDKLQILKNDLPITTHANGARRYLCLIIGYSQTCEYEERHLKPLPKSRQ